MQRAMDAIGRFNAELLSVIAQRRGVPFLSGLPAAEVAARLPDGMSRHEFDATIASHRRRAEIDPERVWEIYCKLQ